MTVSWIDLGSRLPPWKAISNRWRPKYEFVAETGHFFPWIQTFLNVAQGFGLGCIRPLPAVVGLCSPWWLVSASSRTGCHRVKRL